MTNKNMKISVVMVNYNGKKYLERTIPAMLEQNFPNYEFIVVDNGSTDGSLEYISSLKKVKLVKSPREREKNFACNYAIKKAKGQYIFLCDNDLLVCHNDLLSELLEEYGKFQKCGSITTAFYNEGEDHTRGYGVYFGPFYTKMQKAIPLDRVKNFHGVEVGYPHGIGVFIKKDLWETLGGYNEMYKFGGDDDDLGIKILLSGYKNYLYARTLQKHIGISERKDNKKYALKFREVMHSKLSAIVLYYSKINVFVHLFLYLTFSFLKSLKQFLFRMDIGIFIFFLYGLKDFIKNFPRILRERRKIQAKRTIGRDVFLYVKPKTLC